MRGFEIFRTAGDHFVARTPRTAMKAVEAQVLPMEAFITLGTSVKSLAEEPYDLLEIERVLSREDLDLATNRLLVDVFRKLTGNPDQEIALFAAESINLIENRYNRAIEQRKEELDRDGGAHALLELVRLYYEYAQLNRRVASMRDFYLREARGWLEKLPDTLQAGFAAVRPMVMVFVELGLYDRAVMTIDQFGSREEQTSYLLLRAEVEFRRRDFVAVFEICTRLLEREDRLSEEQRRLAAYWLGRE